MYKTLTSTLACCRRLTPVVSRWQFKHTSSGPDPHGRPERDVVSGAFKPTQEQQDALRWASSFTRSTIPIHQFHFAYARSSGAGGQLVNRVDSKVEMRFRLDAAKWLPIYVRRQLKVIDKGHVTHDGDLIMTSQTHREQHRNRQECVDKLYEHILKIVGGIPKETTPEKHQHVEELMKKDKQQRHLDKRMHSKVKADRKTPRDF